MGYLDSLYGWWNPPPLVEKLSHTKEAMRARNITLATTPNSVSPLGGGIPSRFHHGMGVGFLGARVTAHNRLPQEYELLLTVCSLVHDWGNPPFAHLGERFLKKVTGKDGESFLAEILDGSESERILREYGLSVAQVVRFVTGDEKPLSEVLNGSLDIDNLDNVLRVNAAARLGAPWFDAAVIASSFRFLNGRWTLLDRCWKETKQWQRSRATVYGTIYGAMHLSVSMMIYRAVELAFFEGNLTKSFFFLDDHQALQCLLDKANPRTVALVDAALRWNWFEEIVRMQWNNIPSGLISFPDEVERRWRLAQMLCHTFQIPNQHLAVYTGKGRAKRRITIPFIATDGTVRFDQSDESADYQVCVYTAKEFTPRRQAIARFLKEFLSLEHQ